MSNRYRAVILGAGSMGTGTQTGLLSHAKAYHQHRCYELVGVHDVSSAMLQAATTNWCVKGYDNIDKMMQSCKPQIVSICTPDHFHADQLIHCASYSPQAIIIEKPVMFNAEVKARLKELQDSNLLVAVNYTRRYIPVYSYLKDLLAQQNIRGVCIRYAKGLMHNGSHAIDLIRFLIGEITDFSVLSLQNDYLKHDPSITVHLKTGACENILLQALNQNDYVHFEVDIFTDSNRYTIHSDHQVLSTYQVKNNQGIPPGKRLVLTQEYTIDHQNALLQLLENVMQCLEGKPANILSLEEALKTETITAEICSTALKKFRNMIDHAEAPL